MIGPACHFLDHSLRSHYTLKNVPAIAARSLEFLGVSFEDNTYRIRVEPLVKGMCPSKNQPSDLEHHATICINPRTVWFRCYGNHDSCQDNALKFALPKEQSLKLFPSYHDAFSTKYGVKEQDNFKNSFRWLRDRFLYSNRHNCIVYKKVLYMRNEFGIFEQSSKSLPRVIDEHFIELRKACEMRDVNNKNSKKESKNMNSTKLP